MVERCANDPRIKPQKRLLTPFLLDKRCTPIPEDDDERVEYPFRATNFFSEIFFNWCGPILKVGYRRTLCPQDLYKISPGTQFDTNVRAKMFSKAIKKRKAAAESKHLAEHNIEDTLDNRKALIHDPTFKYPEYLLLWALHDVFKYHFDTTLIIKFMGDVAACLNTLLVRRLINAVAKRYAGEAIAASSYGCAVGISLLVLFQGLTYGYYFHDAQFCGGEIRGVLNKVLLDKSFHISREGRVLYPPSKVTSFLGNDISKVDLACAFFAFITNLPVGLTLTIILLAINLGAPSLGGVAFFIAVTLIAASLTKHFMKLRSGANEATDIRIKYVKEILGSIKIIKYYAWEIPYSNLLSSYRESEMSQVLHIQIIRNTLTASVVTLPNVSAMIGFLIMFAVNGGHLNSSSSIFSSLTLYNIMTPFVAMFPTALTTGSDALVALKRLQGYLLFEDEEPDPNYHLVPPSSVKTAIKIHSGAFRWGLGDTDIQSFDEKGLFDDADSTFDDGMAFHGLKNINLDIKHGEFVVVTGSIGSGKSSLLAAIKGAMPRTNGEITVGGNVTLCANPWIQNATVRDNIYFGNDHDYYKYNKVVDSCALAPDFDILPAGDQTEIGERGVNLSGGQKARINLARAVYNVYGEEDKNIILFDDVLSAVDAKVGRHIMNECILGLLHDKTRILATHQLSLIGAASRIIFLDGDGTIDVGTQEELTRHNSAFAQLMKFQMEDTVTKEDHDDTDDEDDEEEDLKIIRQQTTKKEYEMQKRGQLIQDEVRKVNAIPLRIITSYIREGCGKIGTKFMITNMISSMAMTTFCMLFQNVWLSFWSSEHFGRRTNAFYIGIYVMFTFLFVLTACWQFCTVVYICNNSAKNLNIKAMKRIMYAPMSFFDTTPMGRILNRFTKDTDALDNEIAEQARLFCFGFSNIIGILIMCCIFLPWFAICVPLVIGWTVCHFSYFEASAREVQRIEGVQRSVVFSNFDEVLQGVETIKFYDRQQTFSDKNTKLINKQNEAYLLSIALQRWLVVRLHFCSCAINVIIELLVVSGVFAINASSSGLLISYLVSISSQLISTTRSMSQLDQYLTSIERVAEYALELPQEASYRSTPENKPRDNWPENGEIQFKNLYMRYRSELPYVLTDYSVHVKCGEKIGICGRTGAGKSTIMTALYRLSEPEEGSIHIDGMDTLKMGLYDLRSRLTIIPQEPVLFRGSIRQNLDPFEVVSDADLYSALVRSGCISPVDLEKVLRQDPCHPETLHKFHLDGFVEDNGANFSLGQRQVLALCRALVKETRILILDEATSSVDYETDAHIQQTIQNEFADCTILCIAHRLKTIVNYDRILVMDRGQCKEFDVPWALYNTKDSIFRSMCDKSGIGAPDFLNKE